MSHTSFAASVSKPCRFDIFVVQVCILSYLFDWLIDWLKSNSTPVFSVNFGVKALKVSGTGIPVRIAQLLYINCGFTSVQIFLTVL